MIETTHEEAQTLDLDKDFNSLNVLKDLKEIMKKEVKKIRRTMNEHLWNVNNREILYKETKQKFWR